jgi:hypothetical protein
LLRTLTPNQILPRLLTSNTIQNKGCSTDTAAEMKSIKIVSAGKAEVQDVPQPEARDDCILVKVAAVALNPTDW